jgi:hypothetical protein
MRPIQHESNNDVLLPPLGATREQCQALPITRVLYSNPDSSARPIHGVISYWTPSPEQLALLNQGKPVYLSCMGSTHPPVAIGVDGDGRL